jgi:broad specificity phosphatase PhoE
MLAEQLAGDGVAAIYSSDLRRAAETARIVADRLGLAVTEKPELREIDVGSWSGLTTEEVRSRFPEAFERWRAGELGHDGETREELALRVVPTVEAIARAHAGDTVLVVTHGGVIQALRRHAAGEPGESLENGATFALALVEGALVVHDG